MESKYAARPGNEFSRFACGLEENNDLTKVTQEKPQFNNLYSIINKDI